MNLPGVARVRVRHAIGWQRRRHLAWSRHFLLLAIASACLRDGVAAVPTIPASVANVVRQRVDYGYSAGIAVGMVNRDGRAFLGHGRKSLTDGGTIDERTVFEIGSVTKVFTCSLLAEMIERGEVELNQSLQSLLPESVTVPRRNGEITLEHLALHTSGLPTNPDPLCGRADQPFDCLTEGTVDAFLNRFQLPREPGAGWEYSNLGMGLLGRALALRAGTDYQSLLRSRILEPLGLASTRIDPDSWPTDEVAMGHSGVLMRPPFRIPVLEGAGALRSTVEDLLTFASFNLGLRDTPLSAALASAHRRRAATTYGGVSIGLGWWLWGLPGGEVIQHGGDTPGFTAFVGIHKGKGLGVVVLSNARGNTYSAVIDVGLHLLDSAYPLTSIRRPASVDAGLLANFAGIYREPTGDTFELGGVSGRLVAYHPRSNFDMTLYPESTRRFAAIDYELGPSTSATFRLNAQGRVTGMDWTQNGGTTTYSRHAEPASLGIAVDAGARRILLRGGADVSYAVEASTDLRRWVRIGLVKTGDEGLTDPTADSSQNNRYYRAVRER
ncbi:MAG: serine hydrolase domain-containing protein [Limisphaerales bacterium]